MFVNLLFLFLVISFFIVGGVVIVMIDFCIYCLFNVSPLIWLEKNFFERFGK